MFIKGETNSEAKEDKVRKSTEVSEAKAVKAPKAKKVKTEEKIDVKAEEDSTEDAGEVKPKNTEDKLAKAQDIKESTEGKAE